MTWSYTNPSASPKDEVRYWLQDTVSTRELMQDEEIDFMIERYAVRYGGSNVMVAAYCADTLAGRFASEVSINADGTSIGLNELQQKYTTVAQALRDQYQRESGLGLQPYVGGITRFEAPDFDVKEPVFGVGMDDNFEAGKQNYGRRGQIPEPWMGDPGIDF